MRKFLGLGLFIAFTLLLASPALAAPMWDRNPKAFKHGIALDIDGETWYFKGPGSVMGVVDVPGHTWVQTGPHRVKGRHYNVGPWMVQPSTPWWAPNETYGVLLFMVDGIIAPWTAEIAERMATRGYVHYHELVNATSHEHPTLVVWLKHTAVRSFWFASPPMPLLNHTVTPGIDYDFMPNWFMPY